MMREHELDFHHVFRKLANIKLFSEPVLSDEYIIEMLIPKHRGKSCPKDEATAQAIREWLNTSYKSRSESENNIDDAARKARMDKVNPNFVLRNWILDEVIDRVQRQEDAEILDRVLNMALNPFRRDVVRGGHWGPRGREKIYW